MSLHIDATDRSQIAEAILLPGDPLRAKYIAENFLESPKQYNTTRNIFGYTGLYKGVPVSVQGTGMGMPSMGIYSWELMTAYDVQRLIRVGTAGTFREDIQLGDVVLVEAASTDSNYMHAFDVNGTFAPCADWDLLYKAYNCARAEGIRVAVGNMVSCDVFYEFGDWWKKWAKMGVIGVEMEAAALYINAAYNKKQALAVITISDHFITGGKSTKEEREKNFTNMMKIALETAVA